MLESCHPQVLFFFEGNKDQVNQLYIYMYIFCGWGVKKNVQGSFTRKELHALSQKGWMSPNLLAAPSNIEKLIKSGPNTIDKWAHWNEM